MPVGPGQRVFAASLPTGGAHPILLGFRQGHRPIALQLELLVRVLRFEQNGQRIFKIECKKPDE